MLIRRNEHALLESHLGYYRKRMGETEAVMALAARAKAASFNYRAHYDSAGVFLERALALNQKLGNKEGLAGTYAALGNNETYLGNFERSLAFHYQALDMYTQLRDTESVFRVQGDIAVDHYYQKDFDKAVALLRACQAYYERMGDSAMIAETNSSLSTCFYNLKEYGAAVQYALNSLAIRKRLGGFRDIGESLNNLALPLLAQRKWDEAAVILRESLSFMEGEGDKRQLPIIRQNLASCLWETGNVQEALAQLALAAEEAHRQGQKDAIANAYLKLSNINKKEGRPDTALYYYKLHKAWKDSLYDEEKARAISELNIRYETQKKEELIKRLDIEKQLYKTKKIVYMVVALFILLVAVVWISYMAGKNRRHRLHIEQVTRELATHKKELESFTKNLLAKSKSIEELEARLEESDRAALMPQGDGPVADHLATSLYQLKILTEEDWTEFKLRFDKAYPNYINRLREQFPGLAPGDQRQFLLIKLNIENKECANMLGISIDSVKKNKYRLKKKFNLSEKDSLDDFVRDFGAAT